VNINEIKSELGEGLYWSDQQGILYWLDINNSMLFSFKEEIVYSYNLLEKASVILNVENQSIYLASENGIFCFVIESNKTFQVSHVPLQYSSNQYRTNDGTILSKNLYMYGIMNHNPSKEDGALIISKNGKDRVVFEGIAIPNTFIRIPQTNSLLISDSFEQKTFRFDFNNSWDKVLDKSIWLDLSSTKKTPDGGCISSSGRIFISIWDGFEVLELDLHGKIVDIFKLPVPRPTNCVLNSSEDSLFVTSAFDGLSKSIRKKYPLSGSILTIDLND
jgi:sugar lactone lactonase YvrE